MRRLISGQNACGIHVYLYGLQLAGGTLQYIQRLRWLKDRGNSWHLCPMKNLQQVIMLRGIAWLAQLKR